MVEQVPVPKYRKVPYVVEVPERVPVFKNVKIPVHVPIKVPIKVPVYVKQFVPNYIKKDVVIEKKVCPTYTRVV
jgi:hypothetical protein